MIGVATNDEDRLSDLGFTRIEPHETSHDWKTVRLPPSSLFSAPQLEGAWRNGTRRCVTLDYMRRILFCPTQDRWEPQARQDSPWKGRERSGCGLTFHAEPRSWPIRERSHYL